MSAKDIVYGLCLLGATIGSGFASGEAAQNFYVGIGTAGAVLASLVLLTMK